MRSKPFYMEIPGGSARVYIVFALMLLVIGIAIPYILIAVPFLLWYGLRQYKRTKNGDLRAFKNAVIFYEHKNIDKSREELRKVPADKGELKIRKGIMEALISYEEENYEGYIEMINAQPQNRVRNELDIQLKLGESYMKTNKFDSALEVYKGLLKFNPKSEYINNRINDCMDKSINCGHNKQ